MTLNSVISKGLRILVVDDNANDRRLLTDCLREQGYRLYVAEDGHDGIEKARLVQPDLVMMDVCMPVCDGIAACRLLKTDPRTAALPVIFLTAAAQPEDRVRGLMVGAVDYIAKPFDFDEVRLRVSIHLKAWRHGVPVSPQPGSTVPDTLPLARLDDAAAPVSNVDALVFRAAQRLLHDDLAQPPDLAGLAKAVGTNARRLNEAFRSCAGATVFEYLREARMEQARKLLRETSLAVQVIACDLGYDNPANFSTAFRARFGLSPRDYRKAPGAPPLIMDQTAAA
ncbi:response regulator [Malikia sp.]|uniref:response regulator transcription factor n=1 Tax=Malikia sp. TaxID=2070706 RepID=UPI00261F0389|nr:response regulator [Malikia sp.]MDD2730297.1 response regulator [Malikia sp.]